MENLNQELADMLEKMREKHPLVHNITNYVVMNYTANALLACSAAPVMAHAPEEVEDMVSIASALVINMGTLSSHWVEAMVKAGKKANEKGVPVVFDPVGSGATKYRTETAMRILEEVKVDILRGNASEILSVTGEAEGTRGVDTAHEVSETEKAVMKFAKEKGLVAAVTGATDLVTDGEAKFYVKNGHARMGQVTGTGCTATALIGAFVGANEDRLLATVAALAYFGVCGEWAAGKADLPGSFQIALLEALAAVTPGDIVERVRVEKA